MQVSSDDQLLASAASFLIEGQEDAASMLLSCSLRVWASGDTWHGGDEVTRALHVKLTCPRVAYEILCDDTCPIAWLVSVLQQGDEIEKQTS